MDPVPNSNPQLDKVTRAVESLSCVQDNAIDQQLFNDSDKLIQQMNRWKAELEILESNIGRVERYNALVKANKEKTATRLDNFTASHQQFKEFANESDVKVKQQKEEWKKRVAKVQAVSMPGDEVLKLDVGGDTIQTLRSTLVKW